MSSLRPRSTSILGAVQAALLTAILFSSKAVAADPSVAVKSVQDSIQNGNVQIAFEVYRQTPPSWTDEGKAAQLRLDAAEANCARLVANRLQPLLPRLKQNGIEMVVVHFHDLTTPIIPTQPPSLLLYKVQLDWKGRLISQERFCTQISNTRLFFEKKFAGVAKNRIVAGTELSIALNCSALPQEIGKFRSSVNALTPEALDSAIKAHQEGADRDPINGICG